MTMTTLTPARVPRLWPGERVVILGGGSSLTRADVEWCRDRAHVIAIKEAVQLAPWADVLYASDAKWWRFYHGCPAYRGRKYAIEQSIDQVTTQWDAWGIEVLRNTGEEGLELNATGLRTGFNSGYQAINVAYHLIGAGRVVLLGFDMWRGPSGQQNWFGSHPLHTPSPYPIFLHAFRSLAGPARAAGLDIVNASRFTVLGTFPRLPLEEALA